MRDIVVGRAREREDDVENSHLRAWRMAPIDSHKRRLAGEAQFCASHTIRHRGSRCTSVWTRDVDDEPIHMPHPVGIKTDVPDSTEINVAHTPEMEKVSHPFEDEATATIEVIPPIETDVPTSTDMSVHTDEGFSGGPSDTFVLTRYAVMWLSGYGRERYVYDISMMLLYLLMIL